MVTLLSSFQVPGKLFERFGSHLRQLYHCRVRHEFLRHLDDSCRRIFQACRYFRALVATYFILGQATLLLGASALAPLLLDCDRSASDRFPAA
jgi:hypothetical protein